METSLLDEEVKQDTKTPMRLTLILICLLMGMNHVYAMDVKDMIEASNKVPMDVKEFTGMENGGSPFGVFSRQDVMMDASGNKFVDRERAVGPMDQLKSVVETFMGYAGYD